MKNYSSPTAPEWLGHLAQVESAPLFGTLGQDAQATARISKHTLRMKTLFFILLLASVTAGWPLLGATNENNKTDSPEESGSSTNFAKQIKPFILKDLSGKPVKYAEAFKGKMLLVFFFTSWAQPCVDQVPALVEIQKQFGGDDFSVVGITLDERPGREVKMFSQKNKVNFPILIADMLVVQDMGGITAVPTLCLVDQNRMLLMKESAVTDKATLEEVIKTVRQHQKARTP
jgi:cytochrome c biogenesis protein CcmG/thiol:disulfide interchange protein DsbE